MQRLVDLIYPPACLGCGSPVAGDAPLCGPCWRETPFITGTCCDTCGTPLPGDPDDHPTLCDDCLHTARPWARGRAALLYRGNARRMVLGLKHGDRAEIERPAARWLARAGQELLTPDALLVPVPAHWLRLLARRYNQAALLAAALARHTGMQCCPDALIRRRRTPLLEGLGREARFRALAGAIAPHPRRRKLLARRDVVLIDDVMTSGATFAAATEACHAAGATKVCVLALARVAKDA